MDYLEQVLEGEEKLRKSEGKARKDIPPPGMDDQAWNIDRFYLQ